MYLVTIRLALESDGSIPEEDVLLKDFHPWIETDIEEEIDTVVDRLNGAIRGFKVSAYRHEVERFFSPL